MKKNKVLAIVVAFAMLLSMVPTVALAASIETMTIAFDGSHATTLAEYNDTHIPTAGGAWDGWSSSWGGSNNETGGNVNLITVEARNAIQFYGTAGSTMSVTSPGYALGCNSFALEFGTSASDNETHDIALVDNDGQKFTTFAMGSAGIVPAVAERSHSDANKVESQNGTSGVSVNSPIVIIVTNNSGGTYTVEYATGGASNYTVFATLTYPGRANGFAEINDRIVSSGAWWNNVRFLDLKIYAGPKSATVDFKVAKHYYDTDNESTLTEEETMTYYDGATYTLPLDYYAAKEGKLYLLSGEYSVSVYHGMDAVDVWYMTDEVENVVPVTGYSAILGNDPNLPSTVTVTTAAASMLVLDVIKWDLSTAEAGDCVIYGELDPEVTTLKAKANVHFYPCDEEDNKIVYGSSSSDSADFGAYTQLQKYTGKIMTEYDMVVNSGTNVLVVYGDSSTSYYDSSGALLRAFVNKSGDNYVFEYYSGTWRQSSIPCEYGVTYRIRTEINIDNDTYRMYVIDGANQKEITNGNATFRSTAVNNVDRVIVTSNALKLTNHKVYWEEGYDPVTIHYWTYDGMIVSDDRIVKVISSEDHSLSEKDAPDVINVDGSLYIRGDVSEKEIISAGASEYTVGYRYVEPVSAEAKDVSIYQGDGFTMPATANVEFSDGQTLKYAVSDWDTSGVDNETEGVYVAIGKVDALGIEAKCRVLVKGVEYIDYDGGNTVVTNNGGWNWYVEPSGTHIQPGDGMATLFESGAYTSNGGYTFTHDKTYMGWVEDCGDICISELDHDTGEYKRVVIHEKLESDDHNNPAVVVLPDGRILAVYSMHTNEPYMYYRVSKNPEDISEWNSEYFYYCQTNTPTDQDLYNATYPTVFIVHDDCGIVGNDVIYMGWRGVHWKPTLAKFAIPDANGEMKVVMGQTQVANTTYNSGSKTDGGRSDSSRRPYTKYDYDYERNKIYITFTSNHPDNDVKNHIWYMTLDIADQNLYTASGTYLQPLPFENKEMYINEGANGTSGQWGIVTVDLMNKYPDLLVFDGSYKTGEAFNAGGSVERRGWTWDICHNEKGEPCIVYADITCTPPGPNGEEPEVYLSAQDPERATRSHHYYWYARWDSDKGEWVNTYLTYGGKWWHQNYTQERCYSGGLTFDHNYPASVIYLSIPTYGKYGNNFEIYRWETDDDGETWTKREEITKDSPTSNARPNAIYNYKMNEDGSNAGPRLLWIAGEYRYWMNYEYKTGVWTDYEDEGFITQDDPEMFADFELVDEGGNEVPNLPVGEETTLIAKYTLTNISIGNGKARLMLAHYSKDDVLKGIESLDVDVPARSVGKIGMVGAVKLVDDGSPSPWADADNRSPMGDDKVYEEIEYTSTFEEGDRVSLFAWGMGIEHPMTNLSPLNYQVTTEGKSFLWSEDFNYDGDDKLILDMNEGTFNGWLAKGYNTSGSVNFDDYSYAAVTKAPFGNTGLHLYRMGGQGIMASHALPDTNGNDYTIKFTLRYISELSWNNTDNIGFTLSHGVPTRRGDTAHPSAYQFRHTTFWGNENGRGTKVFLRYSTAFDTGSTGDIIANGIDRALDVSGMTRVDYNKGMGYYDPVSQTYIHDYKDSLMGGALYTVTVRVSPRNKTVNLAVNDGYRTATHTATFNSGVDWDSNPIDTITFSLGDEKWGEVYIDDIRVLTE